ncbi:hypothetical protein CXG81DRAFT_24107 [Caulochytrium protostelioides]|uniref:Glucose-methanol-choline oxidoreductase N-terminal domain-containing protein n=1 Tax=Caulochytrium protostelioides TaxID=1555241 RepID=A0A4P9XCR5_9FUNG|nr:hypothetical protein CXG81DRAFT_24107 [Caulochytrium protostelioides]|eukprot:RKP03222.1 hypothetical protein CXG81DRAFT_24107 [Caulochytrium protostelioides]
MVGHPPMASVSQRLLSAGAWMAAELDLKGMGSRRYRLLLALASVVLLRWVLQTWATRRRQRRRLLAAPTYDYVIVGGGTAGCVLANRLSEDSDKQVLLIEAGPDVASHPLAVVPAGTLLAQRTGLNWAFEAPGDAHTHNRVHRWPRGKCLGGCTAINAMIYCRCSPLDYDEWEQMGCEGWNYKTCEPYFRKLEHFCMPPDAINTKHHGTAGPMKVTYDQSGHHLDITQAFVTASNAVGMGLRLDGGTASDPSTRHPHQPVHSRFGVDYNGPIQTGAGVTQCTIHRGRRITTASGYLDPVRGRANLTVLTEVRVLRILFQNEGRAPCSGSDSTGAGADDDERTRTDENDAADAAAAMPRAVGVAVRNRLGENISYHVYGREIILCGGAVGTPQLMMLSGLGPRAELDRFGIPVVRDLPGVGQNLTDHLFASLCFRDHSGAALSLFRPWQVLQGLKDYVLHRRGALATPSAVAAVSFFSTEGYLQDHPSRVPPPNGQIHFIAGALNSLVAGNLALATAKPLGDPAHPSIDDVLPPLTYDQYVYMLSPTLLKPYTRGYVRLARGDPLAPPEIVPKYLADPRDMDQFVELVRQARVVAAEMARRFPQWCGSEVPDPQLMAEVRRLRRRAAAKQDAAHTDPEANDAEIMASRDYIELYLRRRAVTVYHPVGTCKMGRDSDASAVVTAGDLRVRGVQGLRIVDASVIPYVPAGNTAAPVMMLAERAADLIRQGSVRTAGYKVSMT